MMSKELTEKWKDGELELNSLWFVRLPCGLCDECFYTGSTIFMKSISGHDEEIWQVLAPVPSYDEYKELTQKVGRLELDNEVLEDVVQECNKRGLENKKLQEQLKEANDCINSAQISLKGYMVKIYEYKKKWGVE